VKSDNVKRSVQVGSPARRAAGDAPSLGKLARTQGRAIPETGRRRRRTDQSQVEGKGRRKVSESRRRVIVAWSFLLAAATLLLLGVFVWQWLIPKMRLQENTRAAVARIETAAKSHLPSKFPSPTEAEACELVKEALAVREVGKVATYFRLGSATAEEVVDFLKAEEAVNAANGSPPLHRWFGSVDKNELLIEGVMLISQRSGKPQSRLAMLTPDTHGKWQIDFHALAQTATPSWHELLENNAPSAQVRVFATVDNYYNGLFQDESQWLCYRILVPEREDGLMAYAKTGSPQAAAMTAALADSRRGVRVTLEIRRVEGGEARQFEISRVLAEDWVMGPAGFDEKFK
jgi:hypothetical protein